jgi:hypothetical protein
MRRWLPVLCLLLAGCGSGSSPSAKTAPPKVFTVSGDVLVDLNLSAALARKGKPYVGQPCTAADDFNDISEGTQVVVADETGRTLALGELEAGRLDTTSGTTLLTADCGFGFSVPNVPDGHHFYKISVGRRGGQQYSRDQLDGSVHLTLK